MPTYLYETMPDDGAATERFEWRQSMRDAPLSAHPETGVPVRRVIVGGLGHMSASDKSFPEPGPGCGPGTCGCGRF
ncbi:MAG: FmdB family zinc ribbon protein [Gemmatimonadaceae bacterium]